MKYKKLIIFSILGAVLLILAIYTSFFSVPKCQSFECYQEKMKNCKPVQYLNDGDEATWKYKIIGARGSACIVEVTLLQPKTGQLGLEKLSGYKMECGVLKGAVTYPEKDLGSCHGRLKEEMQEIMIKKLHTYIINNVGRIDESLNLWVEQEA